jgi:hypothetical protein
MQTTPIYFERHVDHDSKKLIRMSELRRKVVQALELSKNGYEHCMEYYTHLDSIMDSGTTLNSSILFVWDNSNSSCWKFEKLHILKLLSHWAHDLAVDKQPKEAKDWFSKAVGFEIESIKTLRTYSWRDSSIGGLPIMQDRYHLSMALVYASDYFFNMYTFKESYVPVKKSYQLLELASRLWKKNDYEQLNTRHALTLKHMAEDLEDDNCGEKVALMEQALKLHETESIRKAYNLWSQQNDSVYYNEVKTDKTISFLSLPDSFQNLSSIS